MDYTQMVLGGGCLLVLKMVDLADPDVLFYARCAFGLGAALTLLTFAFLYLRIQSANDSQPLHMTNAERNPPQPLAAMLGAPQEPDANKPIVISTHDYDLGKLRTLAQSSFTTMAITVALHAWKGFMPPLILQSVLPLAGLLQSELARIHLFGQVATASSHKDLKRPWKPKSALSAFTELKKEMKSIAAPDAAAGARKNKKDENRKKAR
jgi:hypothetical protein